MSRARAGLPLLLALALVPVTSTIVVAGCTRKATAEAKSYTTKGQIKSFGPDKKFVNIKHDDIPGYMLSMTMSFEPKAPAQLDGLAAGDKVGFSFTDDDGRRVITEIKKEP